MPSGRLLAQSHAGLQLGRAVFRGMAIMVGLSLVVALLFQRHGVERHGLEALEGEELMVGAWLGDWPTDSRPLIDEFEDEYGVKLDLVDVFIDYYTPFANVSHTIEHIAARGALPMLSWEPHGFTTVDIADSTKEVWLRNGEKMTLAAYLDSFAEGLCSVAKKTEQPILLRTLHEMNGFWYTWGQAWEAKDGSRPNTDDNYRRAWIRIHDAVERHCSQGVLFVWATNHYSVGKGASFTGTYPGDAYVDFAAIDGYNWGGHADWGWQTFDKIFHDPYCAVTKASSKPILIAELSSTEKGGDKAEWIRETLAGFRNGKYPEVRGFVWFNDDKFEVEINGRMDWPLDSSPIAKAAFRETVAGLDPPQDASSETEPAAKPACGAAQ